MFDTLTNKRVVLCGAGEMGEETLRYLHQAGASDICILNRSYERAVALSKAFAAETGLWDSLAEQLVEADLVIGTTAATEPIMEYGLLGLADESDPLHVVATPLLVGQSVTAASVEQPGRQVLRMRDEMKMLSDRLGRRLVPIAFIPRHPSSCDASLTDGEFLRGVFVDQVSTVVSFEEVLWIDATDPPCACPEMRQLFERSLGQGNGRVEIQSEFGMAFSLIVNRQRDHRRQPAPPPAAA